MTERLMMAQAPEALQLQPVEVMRVGHTALELLAQPVDMTGPYEATQPPQTPPQRFPTEPKTTPYDIYGNPDVSPPDEEWLYE